MLRDLHHIPLDRLTLSKLNVRRHGPKDVASLAASIAALGVLQPLLVRPAGDGFEIVAGQRRYLAAKSLRDSEPAPLPCVVLDEADDALAIEASLAENIERLPMDEMDQHEAFMALKRKGLSEDDIAAHFGISPQVVRRRVALAALIPDVRRLYRQGEIDARTSQLLTLATKERQRAYVTLVTDPEQAPPPFWQLKAWLLGGQEIATKAALFDEADYAGAITTDLFGDDRYFSDPDEFWRLQNEAISKMRDTFAANGWCEVVVVPPSERFAAWDHEPCSKAKGGAVIIEVAADGHVSVHKGLKPRRKRAGGTACVSERASNDEASVASAPERPEMSAPLANYVDLVRHSTVRLAVAKAPTVALRLVLAHLIGGGTHWHVAAEPQTPHTDAIGKWRETLTCRDDYGVLRTVAMQRLGLDGETLISKGKDGARTLHLFERLIAMPDKDVLELLAVVMADTLAMGTTLVDKLGAHLAVDIAAGWQPDGLFFELVRDREAVDAMLAEVIGETAARSHLTETGAKKKAIIRRALTGDGRAKVEGWTPRYMRFPQAGYTERPMTARRLAGV